MDCPIICFFFFKQLKHPFSSSSSSIRAERTFSASSSLGLEQDLQSILFLAEAKNLAVRLLGLTSSAGSWCFEPASLWFGGRSGGKLKIDKNC